MGKFKRKALDLLKDWKDNYAPNYAALLEGARRVGKSTIAEEFAKQNYRSVQATCFFYNVRYNVHYMEVHYERNECN